MEFIFATLLFLAKNLIPFTLGLITGLWLRHRASDEEVSKAKKIIKKVKK